VLKLIFIGFLILSCASQKNQFSRNIASTEVWRGFVSKFAQSAKMSEAEVQSQIIKFFTTKSTNSTHSNYASIGLSEHQANRLKSLETTEASAPYMPKVHRWVMENIDKIFPGKVSQNRLAKIYQEVIPSKTYLSNPYLVKSSSRRAQHSKPGQFKSIDDKQRQLLEEIQLLAKKNIQGSYSANEITILYRNNLSILMKKGERSPAIAANGQIIVESATYITGRYGLNAMGNGCKSFFQNASPKLIEIKANIDLARADILDQMARSKGKVTKSDLDEATELAFQRTLGYTDDEAKQAVKRLKSKPCQIY